MLMIIFVLFTKTPLLIIVNEIVKVEWMLINKSLLWKIINVAFKGN
jgi:hypothetical protein